MKNKYHKIALSFISTICFSNLRLSQRFGEDGDPVELHYGFFMDDVPSVQDLTRRDYNPFQKFMMYPNPVYYGFSEDDGIKYYKSDYLTINVCMPLDG